MTFCLRSIRQEERSYEERSYVCLISQSESIERVLPEFILKPRLNQLQSWEWDTDGKAGERNLEGKNEFEKRNI